MAICSFCANDVPKGTGILFAKKDGTTFFFCSGKCKKNLLQLKREGRRQKWTLASKKFKELSKVEKK